MTASRPTTGFNFLESPELPAPQISEQQAEEMLASHWGLRARATSLGSQQDKNFLMTTDEGEVVGVLKITNPAFTAVEVDAQEAAAELIAQAEPSLRIAVAQPNSSGLRCTHVDGFIVRLLTFLSGGSLVRAGYLAPAVIARLGDVVGRVSRALAGFDHPGLDRILQWDLKYAMSVVRELAGHVDDAVRPRLEAVTQDAWARVQAVADSLPQQTVHLDVTDANVVVSVESDGREYPDGVIDFGDLTHTWAVSELVMAAVSILQHDGAEPASVLPAVRAFHAVRPLTDDELAVLWPLVVLRSAVLVVSSAQQAALDGDNAYVAAQMAGEWRMFDKATSVPVDVMTALLRSAFGQLVRPPTVSAARLFPQIDPAAVVRLDLRPDCDVLDEGGWLRPGIDDEAARAAVNAGAAAVITCFGEPKASGVPPLSQQGPAVVATGLSVWLATPARLMAPWDAEVSTAVDGATTVCGDQFTMTLTAPPGLRAPAAVAAGSDLADLPAGQWIRIAVRPTATSEPPAFVPAAMAEGWLAVVCDPTPLLGVPAAVPRRPDPTLLTRRDRTFAHVQGHYYRTPPQFERGWRHFLLSQDGRCYLDMVNNVTVLGHSHPRVAEAAARQLRKLNTNSRFNYGAVVEFCERITATLPDPLDTVFLVNSGSEANDLALRLAMAATGRHDVVALREAYHGWTYATDAVSTSIADNPQALSTRPPWVHTLGSPNSFRGEHPGDQSWRYAQEAAAAITRLAGTGRAPAAFICEPVYGSAGGMALPDGYLASVYDAVRGCGGLTIADEVQVGYGRLGTWFWGFEQQQVVPDLVVCAKATGNGYPLGVVVTTAEIAERFRSQGYFFSSTGGSPLSCAVGLAVLDVMRDEGLQANAASVGAHLKSRLQALQHDHPIIGTVHGFGLYLGVELVGDPGTLEPAGMQAAAICERMLDLGVVIQPTGDHLNILKTKPPLCLDVEGADFYVDALHRVLREGW